MKRIPFVLLALLLSGVACSDDSEGPKKEGESDPVTLTLSDPNARPKRSIRTSGPSRARGSCSVTTMT